ncbi:MAG: DUF1318 domain-containing protein [Desulfobacterium sp.]|jgi:uncharacterized protein YdbL (DUF1318 family)|nr:DUF1318 domain-containing protein [Desulfobacterium sp.]
MKTKKIVLLTILVVLVSIVGVQGAFPNGIKERMKQRLPGIVQMKLDGIVGENAQGFLEFVTGNKINADVVEAENKDRQAVYSAISAQQGVDVETVGKRRAIQIFSQALKGEYLKNEQGTWYKK